MTTILARSILISMAAMCFIHLVTAQQPAQQGKGGIDDEHPEQNQPTPQQLRRDPRSLQRQHAQSDAEKTTARIAHKDPCWRKVPKQKTRNSRSQKQRHNNYHRLV